MKLNLKIRSKLNSIGRLRNLIYPRNHISCLIYVVVFILVIVEVITYYVITFTWHQIKCDWRAECIRILLVADPQLIGLHNEHSNLLTPISIWDSDRYLSKTFTNAFQFVQPDVVIFLGDLFDEGSTASDEEFETYVRRFHKIFRPKPIDNTYFIWLPGDNDIGGELDDRVTPHKVRRFEQAFHQDDPIGIKNLLLYKINRLTGTIPRITRRESDFTNVDNVVIGLSHIPLLISPSAFVDRVLDKMRPHLLFTAHTHNPMIISTNEQMRRDRLVTPLQPDDDVHIHYLGVSDIYEIIVPTCSYRMGTEKIGYGFAVIEGGAIHSTVLWSPLRFRQLIFYGMVALFGFTYLFCCCCRRYVRRDNTKQSLRADHVA